MNKPMSKQGVQGTRLAGHELWLHGSCGINFPGEAMNMNELIPKGFHGER